MQTDKDGSALRMLLNLVKCFFISSVIHGYKIALANETNNTDSTYVGYVI